MQEGGEVADREKESPPPPPILHTGDLQAIRVGFLFFKKKTLTEMVLLTWGQ